MVDMDQTQAISQSDDGVSRFMLVLAQGSFPGLCWNERVGPFANIFYFLERLEDCDDDVPNMMLLQTHQVEAARGSVLLEKKEKTAEMLFKQDDLVMAYAAWL